MLRDSKNRKKKERKLQRKDQIIMGVTQDSNNNF